MRKEGLPIETSLQMNLSQHLSMTVQLQQAIQILQFSAQELRAAIEKEYLENPVLEMDYRDETMQASPDIPQDVSISALSDYLGGDGKQPGYFVDDKEKSFEAAAPQCTTLEDELLEQVNFTFQDEMERAIATFIVGSISGQGYLTVPVAEIARATQSNIALVEKVLARVQEFDPAGVGAVTWRNACGSRPSVRAFTKGSSPRSLTVISMRWQLPALRRLPQQSIAGRPMSRWASISCAVSTRSRAVRMGGGFCHHYAGCRCVQS